MSLAIVVCLKQIPNPDLQFQIAPGGKDIKRDGLNYKINGADEAVRLAYDDPAGLDVGRVARILAAALRALPHDLVLTGVQSDDTSNSATGGLLAGLLGAAHASVATKIVTTGEGLEVTCELEGGLARTYAVRLPAVVTVQFGANTPRYAPLPAIMKAARQTIREITPASLGHASWDAIPTPYIFHVRGLSPPPAKSRAQMIPGRAAEQAKALAQLLREKGFVRG